MTSIKKYLGQEKEDITSWLARIVILLLEGIALHAVEHETEEHGEFRRQMRETIEAFELTTGGRDTLIIGGGALGALQLYNRSVERFIRNVGAERQAIIGLMTESVLKLANTSELAGQNLRGLETEIAKAHQLQDLRLLKSKIQDCLESICQEAARQEERARELAAQGANLADGLFPNDQATGLPGWQHAEAYIKEIMDAARPSFVLVLFLKNLDSVNRRVGFAAGDQVLAQVGRRVGGLLANGDKLFRWRGPCFVAVLERSGPTDQVLAEAAKIGGVSLEKEIESQGRSSFFKASLTWKLTRLRDATEADEIIRKIDAFSAEQSQAKPNAARNQARIS
jgi:GGDEF domain-containing protein